MGKVLTTQPTGAIRESICPIRPHGTRSVSVQACRIVAHSWLADGSSRRISSIVETLFRAKRIATLREVGWANSARHEWRNAFRLIAPYALMEATGTGLHPADSINRLRRVARVCLSAAVGSRVAAKEPQQMRKSCELASESHQ
jgi:hypothetical protein